jgi:hypothetical protein
MPRRRRQLLFEVDLPAPVSTVACNEVARSRLGQVAPWIGMPFCFATQLQQKAVATELAALRRLAKSRKPLAKKRNLHGSASVPEQSEAPHIQRPQAPAPKAAPR